MVNREYLRSTYALTDYDLDILEHVKSAIEETDGGGMAVVEKQGRRVSLAVWSGYRICSSELNRLAARILDYAIRDNALTLKNGGINQLLYDLYTKLRIDRPDIKSCNYVTL